MTECIIRNEKGVFSGAVESEDDIFQLLKLRMCELSRNGTTNERGYVEYLGQEYYYRIKNNHNGADIMLINPKGVCYCERIGKFATAAEDGCRFCESYDGCFEDIATLNKFYFIRNFGIFDADAYIRF